MNSRQPIQPALVFDADAAHRHAQAVRLLKSHKHAVRHLNNVGLLTVFSDEISWPAVYQRGDQGTLTADDLRAMVCIMENNEPT